LKHADGFVQRNHHAGEAGELLGDVEGLRQEALGAACASHYEFVFVR